MTLQGTQHPVDYEAIDAHKKILAYAEEQNLVGSEVQVRVRVDNIATVTLLGFLFDDGSLMGIVRFSSDPVLVHPVHYSNIVQLDPTWGKPTRKE